MPTLFTRIIAGEIPGDIVYQDAHVVAFRDIAPKAPQHILIVTRAEITGVAEVAETGDHMYLLNAARKIAEHLGFAQDGYRLIVNQGRHGGQEVPHLHMHLLAGRQMGPDFG